MSELKKHIYDESNGLHYTLVGDYYIPNLTLNEDERRPVGKYGRLHKTLLKGYHLRFYQQLVLKGALSTYLADLDEQAQSAEGVTEQLEVENQVKWVRCKNSIYNRAEEIVL
ncbi:TnpV protein [Clostridium sp. D5]|uniref:TnpV protein n=1 Tax=Clostridium sp. D5 TaxID=556261 RepID=UPI0001FC7A8E|nr:TnpV protein [Clostridium sp. D5]EGB92901.1 TnpV [Clostridium sp. D5]